MNKKQFIKTVNDSNFQYRINIYMEEMYNNGIPFTRSNIKKMVLEQFNSELEKFGLSDLIYKTFKSDDDFLIIEI